MHKISQIFNRMTLAQFEELKAKVKSAGISQSTLSRVKTGKSTNIHVLRLLSEVTKVEISDMIAFEQPENTSEQFHSVSTH